MNILLLNGHGWDYNGKNHKYDCGARGNGYEEAKLTRELADLVQAELGAYEVNVYRYPRERNAFADIQAGSFNYILNKHFPNVKFHYAFEIHFNAFKKSEVLDGKKKGSECYVVWSEKGISVEQEIMKNVNDFFPLRDNDNIFDGVKRTNFLVIQTLKNKGISGALLETCFIDDLDDMTTYQHNKIGVARGIAKGMAKSFGWKLKANKPTPPVKPTKPKEELYRVRRTWQDARSQIGAYKSLANAKKACKEGYSVFNAKGEAIFTNTPKPKKLYLPKTATSWNVYPLNKKPVIGNECGKLNPAKFGGLEYDILGYPQKDVVTIKTRDFGKVNIYVAKSTGAVIK